MRLSALTTSFQHCDGGPRQCNKAEIEIEGIQIGRKEVKVSIFTDHVISYAEHSKKSKHTPTHKTIGK